MPARFAAVEREFAYERHVLRSMAFAHAREVLLEGHVERPGRVFSMREWPRMA
jgi:hypothetical protein